VLHELSTNAAKYGALSAAGGRLAVAWRLDEAGDCVIEWRERDGPPVSPPPRSGFGSALIDRSIPYDLGGEASVTYAPEGVVAHLLVPRRHLSDIAAADAPSRRRRGGDGRDAGPLDGETRVLLVEDQLLIAMDVEQMLAAAGVTQVTTAGSAAEALRRLADWTPDVAVLDVNLGVGTSVPVAEELSRRGVPFIFATGYGDSTMIPSSFAAVPVVRKPYAGPALTAAIVQALEASA
jgi:CheY-like chemotaxis protein